VAGAPIVVDTRNAIRQPHPHVFKLGAPQMLRAETWQPQSSVAGCLQLRTETTDQAA